MPVPLTPNPSTFCRVLRRSTVFGALLLATVWFVGVTPSSHATSALTDSECLGTVEVAFVDSFGLATDVDGVRLVATPTGAMDAGDATRGDGVVQVDGRTAGESLAVRGGVPVELDVMWSQATAKGDEGGLFSRRDTIRVGCGDTVRVEVPVARPGAALKSSGLGGSGGTSGGGVSGGGAGDLDVGGTDAGDRGDDPRGDDPRGGTGTGILDPDSGVVDETEPGDTFECLVDPFDDGFVVGWSQAFLGDADDGSVSEVGGRLQVTGDGTSLYHGTDNGHFVYREAFGDVRITAEVTGFPDAEGGSFAKGGIALYETLDSTSARVMVQVIPNHPSYNSTALQFDYRDEFGVARELGSTPINIPFPVHLAITRRGNELTVSYSTDGGSSWIVPAGGAGGRVTVPMTHRTYVGPIVASYDANDTITAEYEEIELCSPNTDPLPPVPPGVVCEPGKDLDVVYLLDASGSMTASYPGAATKLEAAVSAIEAMNARLATEIPGSRAALVTFAGNSDPNYNLNSAVRVLSGLTGDLAGVTSIAQGIDPATIDMNSTTPVPIALAETLELLLAEHDPTNVPIVIWLTDTVPNIDIDGRGPSAYRFEEVGEISLHDGMGGFLPWGSVAWMGNYNGSIGTFDGEVLANAMYQILEMRAQVDGTVVFGVAIQGDGVASEEFRTDLLEFAAEYTGGGVFNAENASDIVDALLDVVTTVDCASAISGRLWDDLDADGVQEPGEPGLGGVVVELLDSFGAVLETTLTGPDGGYDFAALEPGTYSVRVVDATLPAGAVQTYDLDGTGTPHLATILLGPAEDRDDVDFGYVWIDDEEPVDGCIDDDFGDGFLGTGWMEASIGDDTAGAVSETGGGLEVTTNGTSLYHGTDNGHFVYREASGDFRFEVSLTEFPVDNGVPFAKAGAMLRSGTGPDDARVMVQVVPHFPVGGGETIAVQFDARPSSGAPAVELGSTLQNLSLPIRLAIQKRGVRVEAFVSTDGGATWIRPAGGVGGEIDIPALAAGSLVGVMGASYDASQPITARFDDASICEPEDTEPVDPPPGTSCDPTQPIDAMYLMDMSGSMTWMFPGNGTKFDAAKAAWMTLNDSLRALGNGSRAALVTFSGKETVAYNTTAAVRVRTGFTADFDEMDTVVDGLDVDEIAWHASTPVPLAIRTVRQVIEEEHDPGHTPVIIWISDSLPNVDITGEGPTEYPLEHLQEIPLRDETGAWRSIGDIAWSGLYRTTTQTFEGEPLANSMTQIQELKAAIPDARIFGITIIGDGVGLGTYSFELNQYAAYFTGGEARSAETADELTFEMVELLEGVLCGEPGLASIGDRVWDDVDGDGVQDADEPGLEDVVVDLLDADGLLVASAITDDQGQYLFVDVPPGDYTVVIDTGSLPTGYAPTYDLDGVASPHSSEITVIGYEAKLDVDFGYRNDVVVEPPPVEGCVTDTFEDGDVDPAWSVDFIGDADQGTVEEIDGTLRVTGDGTAMFGSDHGLFVHRSLDAESLRVEVDILGAEGGTQTFRKTGLSIRSGLGSLAPRVTVQYQPAWPDAGGSVQFRYRSAEGGDGGATWAGSYEGITLPVRVAIEKQGDVYTTELSFDGGDTWIRPAGGVQGQVTIDMGDDVLVGLSATSYDASTTITGTFDEFELCDLDPPPPVDSETECVDEAETSLFNSSGGHALWLPGIDKNLVFEGSQGTWTERSDGTAALTGSVVRTNDGTTGFAIEVDLTGRTEDAPAGSPKQELKNKAYAPNGPVDPSTWIYYPEWTGTLYGFGDWEGAVIEISPRGPSWQVGMGANNKNSLDGASAWLSYQVIEQPTTGTTLQSTGVGDFNLTFGCIEDEYCVADALDDGTSNTADHALALPGIDKDFVFVEPGRFVELDSGAAYFVGTVADDDDADRIFDFVVHLEGRTTEASGESPKKELPNGVYAPNGSIDPSTWWYYGTWSGTLYGRGDLEGAIVQLTQKGPNWQIGEGANNKNQIFGASGWLDYLVVQQPTTGVTLQASGDGDFNVDFVCPDDDPDGPTWCPRTPGYWKNHEEVWPVSELEIGGVVYGVGDLLSFLNYGGPDASSRLARHLTATMLNLAMGSDPVIQASVDAANAFLADHPPGSAPSGQDKSAANAIKDELDGYNNNDIGCEGSDDG